MFVFLQPRAAARQAEIYFEQQSHFIWWVCLGRVRVIEATFVRFETLVDGHV